MSLQQRKGLFTKGYIGAGYSMSVGTERTDLGMNIEGSGAEDTEYKAV